MTNANPTNLIDYLDKLDQRDTEELQQAVELLRYELRKHRLRLSLRFLACG